MSDTEAAREIEATIRVMFQKFMDHEPGGVESALHDDCTVWDVFTPDLIQGRAERERFHEADQKQAQARGPLTMAIGPMVTSVWGDTGLARYVLTFAYQPPNPAEGTVRITSVLRREGGRWRIVHHHEGIVPTGVPPIA
jgi:ketosteroid isomerase-like protein